MFHENGDLNKKTAGYVVLVACLGMLFVAMGPEIQELKSWNEALTPGFIGTIVGHAGAVLGAYVGGRMTPTKGEK